MRSRGIGAPGAGPIPDRTGLASALLRKPLRAHAIVEDLVGIAGGLLAHRLSFDALSAAETPIPPERRADILVDPALIGERGTGLSIAIVELAGDRLIVGPRLHPADLGRLPGARGQQQQPESS